MEDYIRRQVSPPLREAFRLMLATPRGQALGQAARRRRARFIVDPTPFLGRASITLNCLRLVIIGADVVRGDQTIRAVESVAHEATHLAQGYWSDSFAQEYQAFVST